MEMTMAIYDSILALELTIMSCIGLILMIPFAITLQSPTQVWRNLSRYPARSVLALLSLLLIIALELGIPRLSIPEFSEDTLPFLAYILSFPAVLTCGALAGPIGFTTSTLCLGVFAVISITVLPRRPTDPIDLDTFLSDAASQLFRLQWFLTVLVGSSLVFIVIQEEKAVAYRELEKANKQKSAFMAFLCRECHFVVAVGFVVVIRKWAD
jgi:hypothetical protein